MWPERIRSALARTRGVRPRWLARGLALGEAVDVTQLQPQQDGREGANARKSRQASDSGIRPPAADQLLVPAPDLLVQQGQQRQGVFAKRARHRAEGGRLERPLPAGREPARAVGGLQIAARQEGEEAVLDFRAQPDQTHPVAQEFPGLAELPGRAPPLREQLAAEEQDQPLGIHAVVLQPRRRDGLGLLRMREHRLMPEPLQQVYQPPPGARGFDGHRRRRRELSEELLHAPHVVHHAMLHQLSLGRQHRDLRDPFVEIHADVYHSLGLLPQSVVATFSEDPAYSKAGWEANALMTS